MRERDDEELKRVAEHLQQPVRFGEAFDEGVMARVRAMPPHRLGTWARLIRQRTFTVRPVEGALAAGLVLALALGTGHALGVARASAGIDEAAAVAPITPRSATNGHRDVQFVLVAPDARKVTVVGDFNDWNSTHEAFQAQHRGGGVWAVTAPVPVGHHRYSFVVDDSVWMTDPSAPRALGTDFGRPSSALVVAEDAGR